MAHEPSEPLYEALTPREVTVLELVAQGYPLAEIGRRISYTESYVKKMTENARGKLRARNAPEAVAIALHRGLIQCPLCRPEAEDGDDDGA